MNDITNIQNPIPQKQVFFRKFTKKIPVSKELKIRKELVWLLKNRIPPELVFQLFDYLNDMNHHLIIKLTPDYNFKCLTFGLSFQCVQSIQNSAFINRKMAGGFFILPPQCLL